jgi:hypothetical protein
MARMTTLEVLRTVAGHGLEPGPGPVILPDDQVSALLVDATAHKLIGLLDQAVAEDVVRCGEAAAARVGGRAVEVAGWSVRLERHLLTVHDLFERERVPHRFVKGATVAQRFYSHPGLRMSVDVDVLVEPRQLERAVAVLTAAGHVRLQRDPYPGFSRRYAKSVSMRSDGGIEVDVHRVVPDGPFGLRAAPEVLWGRPAGSLVIGGHTVPALDPVAAFVQACVNAVASYDMVSLASLRDVVQVGAAVVDEIPAVRSLAEAMGVGACLADAVARAAAELPWDPPVALARIAAWPISPRERQWLDSYRTRPSDARRALLGMHAVPGLLGKAAYLASVLALSTGRPARRRARQGSPSRGPARSRP